MFVDIRDIPGSSGLVAFTEGLNNDSNGFIGNAGLALERQARRLDQRAVTSLQLSFDNPLAASLRLAEVPSPVVGLRGNLARQFRAGDPLTIVALSLAEQIAVTRELVDYTDEQRIIPREALALALYGGHKGVYRETYFKEIEDQDPQLNNKHHNDLLKLIGIPDSNIKQRQYADTETGFMGAWRKVRERFSRYDDMNAIILGIAISTKNPVIGATYDAASPIASKSLGL